MVDTVHLAPGNIADNMTVFLRQERQTKTQEKRDTLCASGRNGWPHPYRDNIRRPIVKRAIKTHEKMATKRKDAAKWLSKVEVIALVAAGGLLGISTSAAAATEEAIRATATPA